MYSRHQYSPDDSSDEESDFKATSAHPSRGRGRDAAPYGRANSTGNADARKQRKNSRERARRHDLKHMFDTLGATLGLNQKGKPEKYTVLAEAIHAIATLRKEVEELTAERNQLQVDLSRLSQYISTNGGAGAANIPPSATNSTTLPIHTQSHPPGVTSQSTAQPTTHHSLLPTASSVTAPNAAHSLGNQLGSTSTYPTSSALSGHGLASQTSLTALSPLTAQLAAQNAHLAIANASAQILSNMGASRMTLGSTPAASAVSLSRVGSAISAPLGGSASLIQSPTAMTESSPTNLGGTTLKTMPTLSSDHAAPASSTSMTLALPASPPALLTGSKMGDYMQSTTHAHTHGLGFNFPMSGNHAAGNAGSPLSNLLNSGNSKFSSIFNPPSLLPTTNLVAPISPTGTTFGLAGQGSIFAGTSSSLTTGIGNMSLATSKDLK